jgi:hypothetical protein
MSRGDIQTKTVFIIIGVVALVFLSGFYVMLSRVPAESSLSDFPCKLSNMIAGTIFDNPVSRIFAVNMDYTFSKTCREKVVDVSIGDEIDFMEKKDREMTDDEKEEFARQYAIEEISDLILRCWSMGGEGRYNYFSFYCFRAGFSDLSSNSLFEGDVEYYFEIDSSDITKYIRRSDVERYANLPVENIHFISRDKINGNSEVVIAYCNSWRDIPEDYPDDLQEGKQVLWCTMLDYPHIEIQVI